MTGLLSPAHVVVLLMVLLLVFGAKRLPELGRSLGSGLREFKSSIAVDPGDERATLAPAPERVADPATVAQIAPERAVSDPRSGQPAA